jgi:hypothetical protein
MHFVYVIHDVFSNLVPRLAPLLFNSQKKWARKTALQPTYSSNFTCTLFSNRLGEHILVLAKPCPDILSDHLIRHN